MGEKKEVRLPDIGDFENVDVAEVLVQPGDRVEAEDSLIVLESDKASMEIPAPFGGVVSELKVSVGDQVSQGALIALIEVEKEAGKQEAAPGRDEAEAPADETATAHAERGGEAEAAAPEAAAPREREGRAPESAEKREEPLSRFRGPQREAAPARREPPRPERIGAAAPERRVPVAPVEEEPEDAEMAPGAEEEAKVSAHASPSVRRLARELGVDLRLVQGSGRKGRILDTDVQGYVKAMITKGTAAGVPIAGVSVAAPVQRDFSKFGPTETRELHRIRKLSAANLHRSWVTVPHVTQFDEADITELDAFRKQMRPEAEQRGIKLTFLPFVLKACVAVLREFPQFNASLDHTGENLIVKRYYHVGVAVDTPNGLVVPVVRDADHKGLYEIAEELAELSEKARARKLRPADLQGASFSISSLGGLGGTFFTPIVNHPEVAILGVGRMDWRPVHQDGAFVPRLVLPLSLSYDHRVVDGADAARFTTRLAALLSDLRRLIL